MLANKVVKRYQHLRKRFCRQNIEVYRLYDWDIPEIRAVVDWYGGHLVVGEYTRRQSTAEWLPLMGEAVAEALGVSREKVHLKERVYGKQGGERYRRIDTTGRMIAVCERDLKFYVNPWDYVDTGLFADHRNTRQMVRDASNGKDMLNLFCYTGSFTCYAARGGARSTVSVDRSRTAVSWAKRNFELNGIPDIGNTLVQAHAMQFLAGVRRQGCSFDLAVVDPPSFFTRRTKADHFDVNTGHPDLLKAVLAVMRRGSVIFFSTNHQGFDPKFESLTAGTITEITSLTIPEDYERKRSPVHRCWKIIL